MFTELCAKILLVGGPTWFASVWNRLSHLIDPGVVNKIEMATEENSLSLMRQFVDDDNIPVFLGGIRRDANDDPECRTMLAPGGGVPDDAIKRFRELVARGVDVARGEFS